MSAQGISFLRRAAVEDGITWFSVHHRVIYTDGRQPTFPGNAHQKIRTAIEDANYWANRGNCVYLAQGMQRNAGPQRAGMPYPSAIRQEPNLVACKNLYMDLDVKPGAYASTKDALIALKAFRKAAALPYPTIIVGSGTGGLHVYWTLSIEFEPKEFRRMAAQLVAAGTQHGLMFDKQCTSDALRLLRIPGTWNFKGGPGADGKPVDLMLCDQRDVDIDEMRDALSKFKTVPNLRVVSSTPQSRPSVNDALIGDEPKYAPSNIDEVAKECPFIAHTLETGGADLVGEPQWHLVTALACHTDSPSETVHRLCEKNQYYTHDATEEKLGIAQRQREQRPEIGPPKCAKISLERPECANCPHLALGTTPLSLPNRRRSSGAANFLVTANQNTSSLDLPEKYYRGTGDLIYTNVPMEDGTEEARVAFEYQIVPNSAFIEIGKPNLFVFDTIQGEKQVTKRLPTSFIASNPAFMETMSSEVLPITSKPDIPRAFMSNYLKLLQSKKENMIGVPAFGWSLDHNNDLGFAYAGKFFSPAGEYKATKAGEGTLDYRVQGDDAIWQGLMNIILTPERPDIACMVATAFSAPLVGMSGENGFLMGLVSTQSGIGKSTSLSSAQAVWAKPIVGGLTDTVNYTFAKCATLRHLPIYYDEIKGEKQIKAMVELVFQLTGGHEKGRSGRGGEMRLVREFETMCAYASNSSIVEAVRDHHQGTDASWLRMFEMQAIIKPNNEANFTSEVQQRLAQLKLNFGGTGAKYAEYLGKNQKMISEALLHYQSKLSQYIGADPQVERFWVAAMATTLLGAYLANKLKLCSFPIDAMKTYMVNEFLRMKAAMLENPSDLGTDIALINAIGAFLNEKWPRNLILLDKTWTSRTRPPKEYAKILNEKADTGWGPLEVQVSGDPLVLRIADMALGQWCMKTKYSKSSLVEELRKKAGARMTTAVLGSGSHRAVAGQNVWAINAKGTIFEEMLEMAVHRKLLPP